MVGRAAALLVLGAALGLYYAFHDRLWGASKWWDIAFVALILIPVCFALVWALLPLRNWRRLWVAALAFGVSALLFHLFGWSTPENFCKLFGVSALGFWFLGFFETLSWVVLVAAIIPWVDAYSVFAPNGPTNVIVNEHRHVFTTFSFAFPIPGEVGAANLGLPDLLFFSLFLTAAARFNLRPAVTWLLMTLSFGATLAIASVWRGGLPALPLLALSFLLANADLIWQRLRPGAATLARPEELAAYVRTGDRETFVSLYGPDFEEMFDLVLRTVRDREVAAVALRDALDRAWDLFREQGAASDVRGWLLTLACDAALAQPRKRRSALEDREGLVYTEVENNRLSDPSVASDRDLVELVWDAAVALDREDYSLLDLHVRRDLSVDELAEHLDLAREVLAGRLSRLCESFDEAVCSTLLATRSRHNCSKLDAELGEPKRDARSAVRRHVRACAECREARRRFVSATEVLGSLAAMPLTPGLREQTAKRFLARDKRSRRRRLV